MIKAHSRTHKCWMRRTSRIYLNNLNAGKTKKLRGFFNLTKNVLNHFIELFWSKHDFKNILASKEVTDNAVKKYGVTARLSQMLAKQSKEIVLSQHKKPRKHQTMPLLKNVSLNVDSRFFKLEKFNGSFDWCLCLGSGFPKMVIPFNNTKHTHKFLNEGWVLSKSIRLGENNKGVWVDLIFEKERPPLKEYGGVLGVDLGFRVPVATSNGELLGEEIRGLIVKSGKRRKSFHHFIQTEINRVVKKIDLSEINVLVLEMLRNVKRGCGKHYIQFKRVKFTRRVNRLLSFWHYARTVVRVKQFCEENGVRVGLRFPFKTSQRCPHCGKIDRRNRNGVLFKCVDCGFSEHADIVGALNLKALWLAGVYSLRSLPSQ